jgi:hypothetical protein
MPRGPKGEKRPADVNARAVMIAKIATGEIEDSKSDAASALARLGGLKGGKARAKKLSAKERSDIAKKAAAMRWAARSR